MRFDSMSSSCIWFCTATVNSDSDTSLGGEARMVLTSMWAFGWVWMYVSHAAESASDENLCDRLRCRVWAGASS